MIDSSFRVRKRLPFLLVARRHPSNWFEDEASKNFGIKVDKRIAFGLNFEKVSDFPSDVLNFF